MSSMCTQMFSGLVLAGAMLGACSFDDKSNEQPGASDAALTSNDAASADAAPSIDAGPSWESTFDPEDPLPAGKTILWVGAHPDDETLVGAAIVRSCQELGNDCRFTLLTHGGGGSCYLIGGCKPDLATVRTNEMTEAAACYGGALDWGDFTNYPAKEHESPDEVIAAWQAVGDPTLKIARSIREFRPDAVVTFHPSNGFTGHVEHRAAASLVAPAIEMAADDSIDIDGLAAYRPEALLRVLNRYTLLKPVMGQDDAEPNASFNFRQQCNAEETCVQEGQRCFAYHESQKLVYGFMRTIWQSAYDEIFFEVAWL
jgi:LmbE family N-acetylglucosaminyl deacetylase